MSTEHQHKPNRRTEPEPNAPVDVALEVALEAADDGLVRRHIRRAQQARVARLDVVRAAGENGYIHVGSADDGALVFKCANCRACTHVEPRETAPAPCICRDQDGGVDR